MAEPAFMLGTKKEKPAALKHKGSIYPLKKKAFSSVEITDGLSQI
jgi:hypothetical protein